MAGLLERMWGDPSGQATTALAGGLLGVRSGNESAAILNALGVYNQAKQQQQAEEFRRLQEEVARFNLERARRQAQGQDREDAFYADPANLMTRGQSAFPPNEMDPEGSPAAPPGLLPPQMIAQRMIQSGLGKQAIPMLQAPAVKPMVVGKSLVTPEGRLIYQEPQEPKEDEFVKALRAAGIDPASPQGRQLLGQRVNKLATHQPAPSASVYSIQEREEDKVIGKAFGEQYTDLQRAGLGANAKIAKLDRLASLLQGVETGKLTPATTELAAYAKELGIEVDPKLDAKQAAAALTNAMALEMRNPQGGAGMPGALSDKDREFLQKTVPSLANTPGGNRTIIETQKRLAKREIEIARIAREYRAKKGRLDEGFFQELQEYADAHPLFSDIGAPTGGSGAVMRFDRTGKRIQ